MADIRDLQLLVSLSRHKHFSRAADDCGISQPAFSARIRRMEEGFALPLVRRGNTFLGFTREGEVVLKWARKVLADVEGMRQEIDALNSNLNGKLAVGVIPTALPFAAKVSSQLRQRHPNLSIEIHALATRLIEIRLNDFSLDAGLMYFEDADPETTEKLYDETYVLIAPEALAPRQSGQATWAEAAGLPLCLLTRDMRNRQFLDDVFERIQAVPTVVMEFERFHRRAGAGRQRQCRDDCAFGCRRDVPGPRCHRAIAAGRSGGQPHDRPLDQGPDPALADGAGFAACGAGFVITKSNDAFQ